MLEAFETLALHRIGAIELDADEAMEVQNEVSATLYALNRDCPGKTWFEAHHQHPAVARALKVDPKATGVAFALEPFRLWHDGERHLILAAHPAPRCLGPIDMDWLDIETVIAWDPRTDTAFVLGDPVPQTAGTFRNNPNLYASPRQFFTDWMRARAEFFVLWCQSRRGEWAHGATETDLAPGVLAIGDIDQIKWRPGSMPENIVCHGIDPAKMNRALIKSAHIPRAHSVGVRAAA